MSGVLGRTPAWGSSFHAKSSPSPVSLSGRPVSRGKGARFEMVAPDKACPAEPGKNHESGNCFGRGVLHDPCTGKIRYFSFVLKIVVANHVHLPCGMLMDTGLFFARYTIVTLFPAHWRSSPRPFPGFFHLNRRRA